jgi:hypothetical protein
VVVVDVVVLVVVVLPMAICAGGEVPVRDGSSPEVTVRPVSKYVPKPPWRTTSPEISALNVFCPATSDST